MEEFEIRSGEDNDIEKDVELKLRPLEFSDFAGQTKIIDNLNNCGPESKNGCNRP